LRVGWLDNCQKRDQKDEENNLFLQGVFLIVIGSFPLERLCRNSLIFVLTA